MNTQYTHITTDSMDLTVENSTIFIRGGYAREKPTTESMDLTVERGAESSTI